MHPEGITMIPQIKKIMLVNIFDGLYGGNWVGLAPYILQAYASQFDVAKNFEILTRQFGQKDSIFSIIRSIKREKPDAIGLSLYVFNAAKTLQVVNNLDCFLFLGGPHVTGVERELLENHPKLQMIVTGEGEIPFKDILDYFAGLKKIEDVSGITTREITTKSSPEILDLNNIPSVYSSIVHDLSKPSNICIETSRGCPYKCGYCAWSFEKKMRYFNIDRVLNDFSTICASAKTQKVYLTDSSLFCNKERAKVILRHIISLKPKQKFYYELHLEQVDNELIDLMAQLPNQDFSFGIQAVDSEPNAQIGRRFNLDLFRKNFQKISDKLENAQLSVDIMYPLPGDTLEGFKRSIEFVLSLEKVNLIKFNALLLLPGSEFFRNREKYGFQLRDEKTRLVASSNTFPRTDLDQAIKYSNYSLTLHANAKFKKCVQLMAAANNVGMLDIMDEVIEQGSIDLYDGERIPEMITAEMTDNEFILASAPAFFNYGKLISSFKKYSDHRYDNLLRGWRFAFIDTGTLSLQLLFRLALKGLRKMLFRRKPAKKRRLDKRMLEVIQKEGPYDC